MRVLVESWGEDTLYVIESAILGWRFLFSRISELIVDSLTVMTYIQNIRTAMDAGDIKEMTPCTSFPAAK